MPPESLARVIAVDPKARLQHCAQLFYQLRMASEPRLSQEKVAESIGVSRTHYGAFERAEVWLGEEPLFRLAVCFQVSMAQLFPEDPGSAEAQALRLTPAELRLLRLLRTFPPEAQAAEKLWTFLAPLREAPTCSRPQLSVR